MAKLVKLSGKHGSAIGNYAIVDDEDYDRVTKYKWHGYKSNCTYYARSNNKINGKKIGALHRFILNLTDKTQIVDHKNGNGLDEQKDNLRICTIAQNNKNCKKRKGRFPYKGIKLAPSGNYLVTIRNGEKKEYVGTYATLEEAGEAYDRKAIELYGEYARLNFPEKDYTKLNPPAKTHKTSNTGYKNIVFHKNINKFVVYKQKNFKLIKHKYCKSLEEAIEFRNSTFSDEDYELN